MFEALGGVFDFGGGWHVVSGDTGQPEMLDAKRKYAASAKGKAARAKAQAKLASDPARAEATRARKTAAEKARRARAKNDASLLVRS